MRYKLLGNSGLRVSELCLGAMTFGEEWGWGANQDESRAMFDAFLEAGGNFIDTANIYTGGTSENFLGEFIQRDRERVVLATKYTNGLCNGDPNAGGNQRKTMMQAVEASLKRLRTDYIDLYWMHIWDKLTPVEEVMRGFDDLVRQGKILYAGISDAPAWWVAQANTLACLRGWTPFVGLQIEYSLLERTPEHELLPMAKALNITVTPWSPLAGGTLAGKYLNADSAEAKAGRYATEMGSGFARQGERVDNVVKTVVAVAQELGVSPSQVSLAWLRYRAQPMIPIIGTRKLSQLQDNLASLSVNLSDEQLRRLDEASRPAPIFPNSFFEKEFVGAYVYGGVRDRIDA
jgi:aryl-alcohol dehydrogenase-like predicted oxidoreductase